MDYFQRARLFRTKKRLGQNFLIDGNILDTIVEKSEITKDDIVVEIGPGVGFLTEKLVENAKEVHAIELDEEAIKILSKIDAPNLNIIHNDVLKTDISKIGDKPVKVIANIPYYITSPILVHLLGEIDDYANKNRHHITDIVLMVQYEVAQRLVANEKSPSKQYGLLSILSNFWTEPSIITKVPSRAFYPSPKVDSAVIRMKVLKEPPLELENPKFFRRVIKAAFGTRRKNIKNALLNGGFDKKIIAQALLNTGFEESVRGETLSMADFKKLSDEILKLTESKK